MNQLHKPEAADPPVEDEDFYFDGPYLVFTESYHRKRGYCCRSGCRHCPYGFVKTGEGQDSPSKVDLQS